MGEFFLASFYSNTNYNMTERKFILQGAEIALPSFHAAKRVVEPRLIFEMILLGLA